MSAPGTPKASEAAVAAVQDALGCERDECANPNCECRTTARKDCLEHDVAWTGRGCPVAVAAADAAAPHIAAQAWDDEQVQWSIRRDSDGFVPERWGGRDWANGIVDEEASRPDGIPHTLVRRTVYMTPWEVPE